jgi:hypothetical protein
VKALCAAHSTAPAVKESGCSTLFAFVGTSLGCLFDGSAIQNNKAQVLHDISMHQRSKSESVTDASSSRTVVAVAGAAALVDQDGHQLVARGPRVWRWPTLGRCAVRQAVPRLLAACGVAWVSNM